MGSGEEGGRFLEAKRLGYTDASVRQWCNQLGVLRKFALARYNKDFDQMNWVLPNWALSEIWGKKKNIVASFRSVRGRGKAKHFTRTQITEERKELMDREREKRDYFYQRTEFQI